MPTPVPAALWRLFIVFLLLALRPATAVAQAIKTGKDTIRLNAGLATLNDKGKPTIALFYNTFTTDTANLALSCYKYDKGDSVLLYGRQQSLPLKAGTFEQAILLAPSGPHTFCLPVYADILKKTGTPPPGDYKTFLTLTRAGKAQSAVIAHHIDSLLSPTSPLTDKLDKALLPNQKTGFWHGLLSAGTAPVIAPLASTARQLARSERRVAKLYQSKGITAVKEQHGDKEYINLFYEGWFVGRYEVALNQSLESQLAAQKAKAAAGPASLSTNDLTDYHSLSSQFKELNRDRKKKKELTGQLAYTNSISNSQEAYSSQDNRYQEFRGEVETEVGGIPIQLEGYYTTQDNHRAAKASYIHLHYDVQTAKDKLLKLVDGYRDRYTQTVSKGAGMGQVYGSYLGNLQGSKDAALNDIKKEGGANAIGPTGLNKEAILKQITAGITAQLAKDTAAMKQKLVGKSDSALQMQNRLAKAQSTRDSAEARYQRLEKRYEQAKALEEKIEKYSKLLAQYKNTQWFDSAMTYSKVKDLENADNLTYKQLAQKASGILPEGKAKTFVAGLTNLDAGIFPKYVSKYTMSGQQLKGLDVGYDFGICQAGVTLGSTQYISRDGTVDNYSAYSLRTQFRPVAKQVFGFVYYGYSPSASMFKDNQFLSKADVTLPSFRSPQHVVSLTYTGKVTKYVNLEGEAATSMGNEPTTGESHKLDADHLAWHLDAEGDIPKTTLNLTAGYEHGGKDFRNSTLPLTVTGTDRLHIGGKGDFFSSFLTLGVEYNHLTQSAFATKGGNSRWGFDIATHSKRYPSFSLSYKPFTTFRSYTDTLAIPQKPLQGAVWTGRASYQWKRSKTESWRFTAVLNRSTSTMDTSSYGSDLVQFSVGYTTRKYMVQVSIGDSKIQSSQPVDAAHAGSRFATLMGSYNLSKNIAINGGGDIGIAGGVLTKWGSNAGINYRMERIPITLRLTTRYGRYRLSILDPWQPLATGTVDLIWNFKTTWSK